MDGAAASFPTLIFWDPRGVLTAEFMPFSYLWGFVMNLFASNSRIISFSKERRLENIANFFRNNLTLQIILLPFHSISKIKYVPLFQFPLLEPSHWGFHKCNV